MMAHKDDQSDYSYEITNYSPHHDDKFHNPVFEKILKALSKSYGTQGYDVIVPVSGWLLQKMVDPNCNIEEECKKIDIVLLDRLTWKQRVFYGEELSCTTVYNNLEKEDKPNAINLTRYRETNCLCSRFRLDGY